MTMFTDFLQFPFFVRALTVGGMIGLLLSWMSGYVVLRREVLFTHALSNIGFFGIAVAILFQWPITLMLLLACFLGAYFISMLQRRRLFHNDSLLGIFSQVGLALAIMVIAFFPGYRVNIEQFLFGDILGISRMDVRISVVLFVVVGIVLVLFHRKFLMISLSEELSHSLLKRKKILNALFIGLLALVIAMAMKIIGVLLVAAFTTIPSNTAKLFARNLFQTFVFSALIGVVATFGGLYLSAMADLPSGAMIVVVLGAIWILALLVKRILQN